MTNKQQFIQISPRTSHAAVASNDYPTVVLKPKRDKPVRQRHPWIFSGAIQQIPPEAADGDVVNVANQKGEWLACGLLNRASQIQVRLLSWDPAEPIDDAFWLRRLSSAIELRYGLPLADGEATTRSMRLVHGESDFLPGLTVDQYGDYLAVQIGSLGIEQRKETIANLLLTLTGCKGVIDRSDSTQRRKEKIQQPDTPLIAGHLPSDTITIQEAGLSLQVDLMTGQKTGFYLDQRDNRQKVAAYCRGKRVLNAFSYTGAFAAHALAAGAAHVTNVDSSSRALMQGEENLRINGFEPDTVCESIAADLFELLRDWRDLPTKPNTSINGKAQGGTDGNSEEELYALEQANFDVIILDPPKFAHTSGQIDRALRGYKDINMLAMQLLPANGILATFSCSGLVSTDLFQKVLFGAALDAGRDLQILEQLGQPADHPIALSFPEGSYLKGFICRVL